MTDHERLVVAYFSDDTEHGYGGITMQEVVSLLYELGAKPRQLADERRVAATVVGSAPLATA
jgi:hypothetical protein